MFPPPPRCLKREQGAAFFRVTGIRTLEEGWREREQMSIAAKFIEKWKELETVTHLSFPTWNGREVEKFLKQICVEGVDFTRINALRMVRNALTHNTMLNGKPIVMLNEEVIPFLDEVIAKIKCLPTAEHILIPRAEVFSCSLDSKIHQIVDVMLEKVYSHVPVLDANGKVVGAFSESTMLEMEKAGIRNDGETKMCDIDAFLPLEKHTVEVFRFVPRNDPIAHLRYLFAEALKKHERIGMIFVTETGKDYELLLGILTVWDIAGVSDLSTAISMQN